MSVPPTQIIMLDFPPCELPKFMKALCSALPGSVWFSELIHNYDCPINEDKTLAEDKCICAVAPLVIIKRLRPSQTISVNGAGGGRAG